MTSEPSLVAHRPGLIWGFDFADGSVRPIDEIDMLRERAPPAGFRWLHLNLADQRTRRWLADPAGLPKAARDLLLSADDHQRAVVEGEVLTGVLHDVERDFGETETRVGAVRFALSPRLMITARSHPLRSGDVVRQRILGGAPMDDAASALDLLLGAMTEVARASVEGTDQTVQALEDALLKDQATPATRELINVRTLMARLHRMLSGLRAVLRRLEDDEALPAALQGPVAKAAGRLGALDAELLTIQSELRLLREELDLQATQRTNQNLYFLSVLTALMLPATLVTGIFGMNTGGLPWEGSPAGTFVAVVLAVGASIGVYIALRMLGLVRR